jgi:hypothetical protein
MTAARPSPHLLLNLLAIICGKWFRNEPKSVLAQGLAFWRKD